MFKMKTLLKLAKKGKYTRFSQPGFTRYSSVTFEKSGEPYEVYF